MQTIKMGLMNQFLPILSLYEQVSSPESKSVGLVPQVYDTSFNTLFDILEKYVPWFKRPITKDLDIKPLEVKLNHSKDIIVCVSGGKDSVATATLCKKLGYNVHLYHLHGINKVYYDEYKTVLEVAKYLGVEHTLHNCTLSGRHNFVEHPLKNFIIACGAIQYALENDLPPVIAFGNFIESSLDTMPFDVCAGDSIDMWHAFNEIMDKYIPGFHIQIPLVTQKDTIAIIQEDHELLRLTQSCISPFRFREHWKERTETKYGINLMPKRCGCCWKCAVEYITFADLGQLTYNESYYIHCLEILGNTLLKEKDVYSISVRELWSEYLTYDMSKSKLGGKIYNGIISNAKARFEE